MRELSVAILGPGAIGGFLSSVFWANAIDVTCIARQSTVELINREGLHLQSVQFGDFNARPKAVVELHSQPDVVFITTKAVSLEVALQRIPGALLSHALIIPLLNGIEHMQLLRAHFGRCVVAGAINIEAKYLAANHVAHVSPFARIELANNGDIALQTVKDLAAVLAKLGLDIKLCDSETAVLWGKLVRLSALACTTAASDRAIGWVRTDPKWRKLLQACVDEAVAVAQAEQFTISPETVLATIAALPASLGTSLQRDIAAGKTSELDAIVGAVVRAGARHGLLCPTILHLIRVIERRCASQRRPIS